MTLPLSLAAYNFDETGNTVTDFSAAGGNDFSIAGASVTRVAGHTGTGLRSTGSAPPSLPDVGRTTARTIMAWLDLGDAPSSWPVLFNVPSLDSGGWGILYLAPNICVQARNASTFVRPLTAWPGGAHHVAGTYDGTTVRLYLDGAEAAAAALAGPLRTDTDPPVLWSGTSAMTSGYLDDLRIYDVALTAEEVALAAATPVTDETPETPPPTTPDPAPLGGWDSLLDTMRWNAAAAAHERENDPVACPQHGDPLDQHNGKLHCPMGHFVARH